jgi:Iron-sulfur cluster assembly protein
LTALQLFFKNYHTRKTMMEGEKQNANPTIYLPDSSAARRKEADLSRLFIDDSNMERDEIDAAEIFDLIRHVNDPEHPLTLEQLKVATVRMYIIICLLCADGTNKLQSSIRKLTPIAFPLQHPQLDQIDVSDALSTVDVQFTPTIPHCSMATLIGLCIRVKLLRSLPPRFKVRVNIRAGTHASEEAGTLLPSIFCVCT